LIFFDSDGKFIEELDENKKQSYGAFYPQHGFLWSFKDNLYIANKESSKILKF
jgi:hypothetical protein